MKHFSTDLDRDEKNWDNYPKDDPEQSMDILLLLLVTMTIVFMAWVGVLLFLGRNGFWDRI